MLSSPLPSSPLLSSHSLSLAAGCPLWDTSHARAASLCSTMRMGGTRVSDGMRLARHGNEPEIDLWVGDALPSTVLLLCILVKGSTAQYHSWWSTLPEDTQTPRRSICHHTHADCPQRPTACPHVHEHEANSESDSKSFDSLLSLGGVLLS